MKFVSVAEIAEKWQITERSVRKYCNEGRVEGAVLEGKTWKIPADARGDLPEEKEYLASMGIYIFTWKTCY